MADDSVRDPLFQCKNIIGFPSRKHIICSFIWILFILILVVIVFSLINGQCCKQFAKQDPFVYIRNSLDISVNPCENFYNFSCGLWASNNVQETYKSKVTTFNILQDEINKKKKVIFKNSKIGTEQPHVVNEAIRFFNACIYTQNLNTSYVLDLLEYFNEIGGWPLLNDTWNEHMFDWFLSSVFLKKNLNIDTIISVKTIDQTDGPNLIYLKPPDFIKSNMLSYSHSFDMFLSILNVLKSPLSQNELKKKVYDLIKVEERWWEALNYSSASDPTTLTIKNLIEHVPNFKWLTFLQLIVNDTLLEINETLTMNDKIVVDHLDYFQKLSIVLMSNSFLKRELADLFIWFAVQDIWIFVPGVFKKYAEKYDYNDDDLKIVIESKCLDLVFNIFSCSFDYLFVKNSSNVALQDKKVLITYLKSSFKDILSNSSWLDQSSKESGLHKLENMQTIIGFPSYLTNKTTLDKMYQNFPSVSTNILKSYVSINQYYLRMSFLQLKIPSNEYDWILPRTLTHVSVYYVVDKNAIVFPLSVSYPPFYYLHGPWYLNFGAIGSIIGHEIIHGFDNSGNNGNSLLSVKTGFTNASNTLYRERTKCFEDQYNTKDSMFLFQNNGTLTLRENIADSEGLRLAFKAFKNHEKDYKSEILYKSFQNFSPEQMFFIAYAAVWCSAVRADMYTATGHSFPEIRVNKAVSNSKHFAAAFNCSEGSPMNPVKKCAVW